MRWMLLILGIATPVMADELPAPATAPAAVSAPPAVSAPAATSATGHEDYIITVTGTVAKPAATSAAATVAFTTPAMKAPSGDPTCDDIKVFKGKMHAAVDAALRYPAELKFRPAAGVTFVAYEYQDGRAEDVHITQWSGDGRLDRAAVAAVKNADFASIRPGIGHKRIHDVVIIIFDNYKDDGGKNTKDQPQGKQLGQDCR